MLRYTSLVAASVLTLAALATSAMADPFYQNDFTTRTSLGLIGGTTTFTPYTIGNLVGATQNTTAQDSWYRRGGGTSAVTVADDGGNQYVRIAPTTVEEHDYANALQKIGSDATLLGDGLRLSIDMSPASDWDEDAATHGQYVFLGDDYFYAGSGGSYTNCVASAFGFQEDEGDSNVRKFMARDGTGSMSYSPVYRDATVATGNWYRFVADLDFSTNSYALSIYDLGTTHPTLATSTPDTPVQTFPNVHFVTDLGTTSSDLRGITAIGLLSYRNTMGDGEYDNIFLLAVPEPGTVALLALAGLCLLPFGRRRKR